MTAEIPQSDNPAAGDSGPKRVPVLDYPVSNLSMDEAIAEIVSRLDADEPSQVCFVNADCVNIARRNDPYCELLRRCDLLLADGIGMRVAAAAAGVRLRDNVNGTDLFPRLCEALTGKERRIFLLGAQPGVAGAVAERLAERHPGVNVVGFRDGYFSPEEEPEVVGQVARSQADVLFVAFGAPKQDLWIDEHLDALGVRVAMGVGGLFDFYSGRIPRAPLPMRRLGLEWLYRLYREPARMWRRYILGNPKFLAYVAAESLRHKGRRRPTRPTDVPPE